MSAASRVKALDDDVRGAIAVGADGDLNVREFL